MSLSIASHHRLILVLPLLRTFIAQSRWQTFQLSTSNRWRKLKEEVDKGVVVARPPFVPPSNPIKIAVKTD